jgi:hypothetical protein
LGRVLGSDRRESRARGVDVVEQGGTAGIDIRVQSRAAPAMYSRDTVIAGSHMLKALGHSGISEFLLEVGLPDSVAAGSGLQARAISLAKFAMENPAELSPAQRTIAFEIIRRATALWQQGTTTNFALMCQIHPKTTQSLYLPDFSPHGRNGHRGFDRSRGGSRARTNQSGFSASSPRQSSSLKPTTPGQLFGFSRPASNRLRTSSNWSPSLGKRLGVTRSDNPVPMSWRAM